VKSIEQVLEDYRVGRSTYAMLIFAIVACVNEDNLEHVMSKVSPEILPDIVAHVQSDSNGPFFGPLLIPSERSLQLVRDWLIEHGHILSKLK
jgi:hypothetical protein